MASKARRKGNYHENFFLKLFKKMGIKTKKQPLSGSLGGEYKGDLVLNINDKDYIAEVKFRDGTFPSPFTTIQDRDIVIYKRKTGNPKWIMILSDSTTEEILGNK